MKTHRYTQSIQNSRNGTDWKTSSWKTKSRMNVTIAICLGGWNVWKVCVWVCTVCAVIICLCLSVHCLCCYHQPAANGTSRTGYMLSQSAVVDPPGAASCSVMHRHATRQVCGKPNYTVIQHLDTRNTDCDRQTIHYAVHNVIFDKFRPAIGRHLNSHWYRWEFLWLCICSECAVLFVKTVCAVYSLWSCSGLWPTPCSVNCCAAVCRDVAHFRHRTLPGDCPQIPCNWVPVSGQMCAHLCV
jgi:hypothetical protein